MRFSVSKPLFLLLLTPFPSNLLALSPSLQQQLLIPPPPHLLRLLLVPQRMLLLLQILLQTTVLQPIRRLLATQRISLTRKPCSRSATPCCISFKRYCGLRTIINAV